MQNWKIVTFIFLLWLLNMGDCVTNTTWSVSLSCSVNSIATLLSSTVNVTLTSVWCQKPFQTNITSEFSNYFKDKESIEGLFSGQVVMVDISYSSSDWKFHQCPPDNKTTTGVNQPNFSVILNMTWLMSTMEKESSLRTDIKEGLMNKSVISLSQRINKTLVSNGASLASLKNISTKLTVTQLNLTQQEESVSTTSIIEMFNETTSSTMINENNKKKSKFVFQKYLYFIPVVFIPIFCCLVGLIVWQKVRQQKQKMETMKPDQWLSDVSEITTIDRVMKPVVHDVTVRVKSKKETPSTNKTQPSRTANEGPDVHNEEPSLKGEVFDNQPNPGSYRNSNLEGANRQKSGEGNVHKHSNVEGDDDEEDNLDGGESYRQKSKSFPGKIIPKSVANSNNANNNNNNYNSNNLNKNNNFDNRKPNQSVPNNTQKTPLPPVKMKNEADNDGDDDVLDDMLSETPKGGVPRPHLSSNEQLRAQRGHTLVENERDVNVDDLYDS